MVNSEGMSADQVEWNMAVLLNMELSKLRSNSNSYFIAGKYREAVDTLIAMKMTGIYAFSKEERKSLIELEKKLLAAVIHVNGSSSFNKSISSKAVEASIKIRDIYPLYNEKLMDMLHAHGFLGGYKKDSGMMRI